MLNVNKRKEMVANNLETTSSAYTTIRGQFIPMTVPWNRDIS